MDTDKHGWYIKIIDFSFRLPVFFFNSTTYLFLLQPIPKCFDIPVPATGILNESCCSLIQKIGRVMRSAAIFLFVCYSRITQKPVDGRRGLNLRGLNLHSVISLWDTKEYNSFFENHPGCCTRCWTRYRYSTYLLLWTIDGSSCITYGNFIPMWIPWTREYLQGCL